MFISARLPFPWLGTLVLKQSTFPMGHPSWRALFKFCENTARPFGWPWTSGKRINLPSLGGSRRSSRVGFKPCLLAHDEGNVGSASLSPQAVILLLLPIQLTVPSSAAACSTIPCSFVSRPVPPSKTTPLIVYTFSG